ncbi:hypothetical protein ACFL5O_02560 [Myxococcota bacterium]
MENRTFLFLAVLAAACSSSDDDSSNRANPLSAPYGLCDAWAHGACNDLVVQRCIASSPEACVATQLEFCLGRVAEKGLREPFDVAQSKACVAGVRDAYSDAVLTAAERETVLKLGEPCDSLQGVESPGGGNLRSGGQRCTGADDVCAEGNYCDGEHCIQRPGDGEECCEAEGTCDPLVPCQEAFLCVGEEGEQKCQARRGLRESCSKDEECAQDLFCSSDKDGKCTPESALNANDPICGDLS